MPRTIEKLLSALSAEFILSYWPNSGSVVFLRSLWISVLVFFAAIGIFERLELGATWTFDATDLANSVREHLHWFGAIFGGVYAALYTRFSSQWTYLANLYNQIMSTQALAPDGDSDERSSVYAKWYAGYIEDAESVHLARKPMYASVIKSLLEKPGVKEAFIGHTINGAQRLETLQRDIEKVLKKERRRSSKMWGMSKNS